MNKLNLVGHPICFVKPRRLTPLSAWHQHIPFAMFLVDILKPKLIVELGTQSGDSYCAFCQAVKELNLPTRCYAIDTWQGDPHTGSYGPEVLSNLRTHHDVLYGSFSRLLQNTFDAAVQQFGDRTIDLLHIDGYHIYEQVRKDFETWLPKISSHGVVLLHDTNVLEGDFGVQQFWQEIKPRYPHFEFFHGHGLGILAVGKVRSKELQALLNRSTQEATNVRSFFFSLGHRLSLEVALESNQHASAQKTQIIEELEKKLAQHPVEAQLRQAEGQLKQTEALLRQNIEKLEASEKRLNSSEELRQQLSNEVKELSLKLKEVSSLCDTQRTKLEQHEAELEQAQTRHELLERTAQFYRRQVQSIELSLGGQLLRRFWLWRMSYLPQGTRRARWARRLLGIFLGRRATNTTKPVAAKLPERFPPPRPQEKNVQAHRHSLSPLVLGHLEIPADDSFRFGEDNLFAGWLLSADDAVIKQISVAYGERIVGECEIGFRREDVARDHPSRAEAASSGFQGRIYIPEKPRECFKVYVEDSLGRQHLVFELAPPQSRRRQNIPVPSKKKARSLAPASRPIDARLSVLLPTKNAVAEDFERTLQAVRSQKHIRETEIIVVDSGSSDGTDELAAQYGAKVFRIPPAIFDHGETRNYAAEQSTGDLLLFTVHDAIPADPEVFYRMASLLLSEPKMAALSVRQVPRSDADLFACWQTAGHYEYVGGDTRLGEIDHPDELARMPPQEVRRLAGLDNVCSLHRRAAWEKIRFRRMGFAEDLDYGIRCLQNGYKIGFHMKTGVVHSHNRPARYHLSKYYTDKVTLLEIFSSRESSLKIWQQRGVDSASQLFSSVRNLYHAIVNFPLDYSLESAEQYDAVILLKQLSGYLAGYKANGSFSGEGDITLDEFFRAAEQIFPTDCANSRNGVGTLLIALLQGMPAFFENKRSLVTGAEFLTFAYKLYAMVAGSELGDYYGCHLQQGSVPEDLDRLHMFLRSGILR